MSITKNVLITAGLTIGLIAAGGTATAFAATPAAGSGLSVVNFPPFPHPGNPGNPGNPGDDRNDHRGDNWGDRGHRGDRDNWGDRDSWGDRDHRGDRDGVSPEQCRDGGGHVNWDRDRCDGGRFDDRRIQF